MKETAKRFGNIVKNLPRISSISKVWNYHCDWEAFVNWHNDRLDFFDSLNERVGGRPAARLKKSSILIIPGYVEDNNMIDDARLDVSRSWFIENKILYEYTNDISEKEFIMRFNKSLYDYVCKEIDAVKYSKNQIPSGKLQGYFHEISEWFHLEIINIQDVEPFFELQYRKNVGGKPPGKSKMKTMKEDKIMELYEVYIRKDIGEQTKKEAAQKIRTSLLTNKPNWWKDKIYEESTIYKVLKTFPK